jgi:hypothetical protein
MKKQIHPQSLKPVLKPVRGTELARFAERIGLSYPKESSCSYLMPAEAAFAVPIIQSIQVLRKPYMNDAKK